MNETVIRIPGNPIKIRNPKPKGTDIKKVISTIDAFYGSMRGAWGKDSDTVFARTA